MSLVNCWSVHAVLDHRHCITFSQIFIMPSIVPLCFIEVFELLHWYTIQFSSLNFFRVAQYAGHWASVNELNISISVTVPSKLVSSARISSSCRLHHLWRDGTGWQNINKDRTAQDTLSLSPLATISMKLTVVYTFYCGILGQCYQVAHVCSNSQRQGYFLKEGFSRTRK